MTLHIPRNCILLSRRECQSAFSCYKSLSKLINVYLCLSVQEMFIADSYIEIWGGGLGVGRGFIRNEETVYGKLIRKKTDKVRKSEKKLISIYISTGCLKTLCRFFNHKISTRRAEKVTFNSYGGHRFLLFEIDTKKY